MPLSAAALTTTASPPMRFYVARSTVGRRDLYLAETRDGRFYMVLTDYTVDRVPDGLGGNAANLDQVRDHVALLSRELIGPLSQREVARIARLDAQTSNLTHVVNEALGPQDVIHRVIRLLFPPEVTPEYLEDWGLRVTRRRQRNKQQGADLREWLHDEDCDVDDLVEILNNYDTPAAVFQDFLDNNRTRDTRLDVGSPNLPYLAQCGHWAIRMDTTRLGNGDDRWCEDCINRNATWVEGADAYYPSDEVYHWDSDNEYHLEPEPEPDEDDDESTDGLMSYSTNVLDYLSADSSFKSSQHGDFHMGVELEMVCPGSPYRYIHDMREDLGDDYCVFKYDGSLPDNGAELVTAPRSLKEHVTRFSEWTPPKGSTAWDNGHCGMHVHISSRAFSALTLGKFCMLINDSNNAAFVRRVAGRHPETDHQAREYCASQDQALLANPAKATKGVTTRYRMVNLEHMSHSEARRLRVGDRSDYTNEACSTIELRIFRASLKKERLLAQLEFAHAALMFCRVTSWGDLNGKQFVKWLKGVQHTYPHLAKWFEVRSVRQRPGTTVPTPEAGEESTPLEPVPAAAPVAEPEAA